MRSPSGNLHRCIELSRSFLAIDFENRQLAADFIGVSTHTIRRWLKGAPPPIGQSFWSACLFFDLLGYKVSEYDDLPDLYKSAIRAFTYGLDEPDVVATYFAHEGKNPSSSLYRRFREKAAMTEEVEGRAASMLYSAEVSEMIREAEHSWLERFKRYPVVAGAEGAAAKEASVSSPVTKLKAKAEKTEEPSFDLMIETLAGLVHAMQPLAKYLESDNFSAAERDLVREKVGQKKLFKLSNILARLCGEEAREIGRGGTNERK